VQQQNASHVWTSVRSSVCPSVWGYLLKRRYFTAIGSSRVKTVADRYRHVAYHVTSTNHGLFSFINFDDLEPLFSSKRGGLANFSQFLAAAHILKVNCDEMPEDRPRQPVYEIFSIKRRFL